MIAYYEIYVDDEYRGVFDRNGKEDFVKEYKRKCHHLVVTYYSNEHRNIGCEEYIEGKLVYEYKEQ